jgi:hypothetical protein
MLFASKTDGETEELVRQMRRSRQKELATDVSDEPSRPAMPKPTRKHDHFPRLGHSL